MTPLFALFDSFSWWARLTAPQQFFYGIGIVAGCITLIMAAVALIGLGDHDIPDATDHFDGSSLISTKPITGFFLGFGWAGGIALEMNATLPLAAAVAVGVGAALMLGLGWMIHLMYSLRSDGTRQINQAIGAIGTVYVTLPPSRASGGQINVTVSGRLETLPALNAALRSIPSGEKVKVVGVVDTNTVLVEPLA
jgi:hypothetical protein